MSKKLIFKSFLLAIILILCLLSVWAVFKEDRNGILTVAFLNIGQGDSIFIEAPNGNQMLIDGGPGRSILRELGKVMPFYDKSIDVVVATHPDADHIAGLNDVLDKYKVDLFLEPGVSANTGVYKELESRIKNSESSDRIKKIEARKGMVIDLGRGTILEILFPEIDPEGMETNAASIVARLVYGENEFMLTGDSPKNIEEYLVWKSQGQTFGIGAVKGLTLTSDVLKVGHHGSKTSSSETFISAVNPEYGVISAGADNRYGHPNQEVLETLNSFNIKTLRTDTDGRIVFESDGVELKLKD